MTNTASSNRFHINFIAKTIVGSKASFKEAGKGYGPVYEELARLLKKHPTFEFVEKVPEKRTNKQTYKGLDISFIRDFLAANDDSITLKRVDNVIAYARQNKEHPYPLVKSTFFEVYNCFDYDEAKDLVKEYRHKQMLAAADEMAAKIAAITKADTNSNETLADVANF